MTTIAHRLETRTGLADRAPLAGLLGLAAVLYLWGLTRNGYANEFYAAAVKAGTQSWRAFLFGSLDASSYITVDKPPASLWLMERRRSTPAVRGLCAGKVHYYVAGGRGGPGGGRGGASSEIESCVTSTFAAKTVGGTTSYDLTVKA
jgi:hypothetical protein